MKYGIIIIVFVHFLSCRFENKTISVEGSWKLNQINKNCELTFVGNKYSMTKWNDDLVFTTEGEYFFNKNPKRKFITISLIPNVQYADKDTIFIPCEYLDIFKITKDSLFIQKSTQWIGNFGSKTKVVNEIEIYSRIK